MLVAIFSTLLSLKAETGVNLYVKFLWLWWVRKSWLFSSWWLPAFLPPRTANKSLCSNCTDVCLSANIGHYCTETETCSGVGVSFHKLVNIISTVDTWGHRDAHCCRVIDS